MLIHKIVLRIFAAYENERTIAAAFHILQGKRSGTTIQDVGLYKLFPYFGILKKFPRHEFDRVINELQQKQMLEVYDTGYFKVLDKGKTFVSGPLEVYFDGWHYRGNEHMFFARLSLVIQALSYQAAGVNAFAPITRDEQVQRFSRRFLTYHNFNEQHLQRALRDELMVCLEQAELTEDQLEIVTRRLHGANVYGYTWQQIADDRKLDVLSCQLLFVSSLHKMLVQIEQGESVMLQQLMHDVKVINVLTDSARLTVDLYMKGRGLEEIAHIRRLKMSTIEDHMVEFAMYEPNFSIAPFVSNEDCQKVFAAVEGYMTKKLKVLKEAVPHLSYFQLKLALAREEIV